MVEPVVPIVLKWLNQWFQSFKWLNQWFQSFKMVCLKLRLLHPCVLQVPMAIAVEIALGRAAWLHSAFSASMMLSGATAIIVGFIAVSSQPLTAQWVRSSASPPRV